MSGGIPVALVGLGRIGSLLEEDPLREKPCTHAGAAAANPDCRLVGGADIDEGRRRAFSERWGCAAYADAEEMLRRERPRILHIATHPDSHAYYCALAEKHGVSVAVCEKPLADSLGAARKIAAVHRRGALRVLVNHERRYAADYRQAKAVLADKHLGALLSVKGTLYMGRNRRILDVIWHDGTHLADAVAFLTESRLRHRRRWGAPLAATTGTVYLAGCLEADTRSPSPGRPAVPFLLEVGAGRDHLAFELECSCERGRLRVGNGLYEIWESAESPYAQGFRSLCRTPAVFSGPTGYFANMMADAVSCAKDPARRPTSDAEDGLRVVEYLNSVHSWGRAGGRT